MRPDTMVGTGGGRAIHICEDGRAVPAERLAVGPFRISVAALLITATLAAMILLRPQPHVVEAALDRFPVVLAGYRGVDDRFPEAVTRELNADASLYRHYRAGSGQQVDLYVGYYGTAKGGRTGHNPYACLPGAGWAIVDSRTVRVRPAFSSRDSAVNYVLARRGGINTVMLHWYQTGGTTVVASGLRQNLERFRGRLLHNRNDGAFVQLTSQVPDTAVAATEAELTRIAGEVMRELPAYWPVER